MKVDKHWIRAKEFDGVLWNYTFIYCWRISYMYVFWSSLPIHQLRVSLLRWRCYSPADGHISMSVPCGVARKDNYTTLDLLGSSALAWLRNTLRKSPLGCLWNYLQSYCLTLCPRNKEVGRRNTLLQCSSGALCRQGIALCSMEFYFKDIY